METEELIKLVDGIYKNILDKFNPGARQMINAGKAYLKALHGAAAASRMYVDAITKLARQAQQGTWGGSSDIGGALIKIVEVYKEIQDQQMNVLKAFYVDLLVPLETNLEKDTKVVQSEQKRFLQQHKQRTETYSKAAATMKKQRKKSRASTKTGLAMDKELKNMQVLEEEKSKLDAFCEQSLKNAMTQERRRYGFVLERHCSLAKHYLSYHTQGVAIYQQNLEKWSDVAKTREYLPESVENIFTNRLRQISVWQDEDVYSNPRSPQLDDDRGSLNSHLRKTKSMDASCLDLRSIGDATSPVATLSRAKSEYNLNLSNQSPVHQETMTPTNRPKSMVVPPPPQWDTQLARALYAYLSSGDNQLSFLEGDLIALIGERNKGWQFGENLRTQSSGWFPLAYTEMLDENSTTKSPPHRRNSNTIIMNGTSSPSANNSHAINTITNGEIPAPRMFGDTLHLHRTSNSVKQVRRTMGANHIPPPTLPAPIPISKAPYPKQSIPQSQSTTFGTKISDTSTLKTSTSTFNFSTPASGPYSTHPQSSMRPTIGNSLPLHLQTNKNAKIGGGPVGNASLHSSNDSGFSNDPPPQPEIDYSDDDTNPAGQTKLMTQRRKYIQSNHSDENIECQRMQMKQAISQGNLDDTRYYMSDDPDYTRERTNGIVKRTKSFWKFGKNTSDNEILEGMALWRHRDLVDDIPLTHDHYNSVKIRPSRSSRDRSNDSDKTISATQTNADLLKEKEQIKKSIENLRSISNNGSTSSKKNSTLTNGFDTTNSLINDQFYDDDTSRPIMKKVNRKDILQQYRNDSSGAASESDSEITSDDPYDCILINDQNIENNNFPNVAEIGKRLERLSKSSKFSPNKDEMKNKRNVEEKNLLNRRENATLSKFGADNNNKSELISYKENGGSHNGSKNNFENETDTHDDRYYNKQKNNNSKSNSQENRRYCAEKRNNNNNNNTNNNSNGNNNNNSNSNERRGRPSYESIDSDVDQLNTTTMRRSNAESEKRNNKLQYYDSANDELSDAMVNNRKYIPRTKLAKSNSNNSGKNNEGDLMQYGETLQRRLKHPDLDAKYGHKSARNGNMYGPWYDLWGLDASVRKS